MGISGADFEQLDFVDVTSRAFDSKVGDFYRDVGAFGGIDGTCGVRCEVGGIASGVADISDYCGGDGVRVEVEGNEFGR